MPGSESDKSEPGRVGQHSPPVKSAIPRTDISFTQSTVSRSDSPTRSRPEAPNQSAIPYTDRLPRSAIALKSGETSTSFAESLPTGDRSEGDQTIISKDMHQKIQDRLKQDTRSSTAIEDQPTQKLKRVQNTSGEEHTTPQREQKLQGDDRNLNGESEGEITQNRLKDRAETTQPVEKKQPRVEISWKRETNEIKETDQRELQIPENVRTCMEKTDIGKELVTLYDKYKLPIHMDEKQSAFHSSVEFHQDGTYHIIAKKITISSKDANGQPKSDIELAQTMVHELNHFQQFLEKDLAPDALAFSPEQKDQFKKEFLQNEARAITADSMFLFQLKREGGDINTGDKSIDRYLQEKADYVQRNYNDVWISEAASRMTGAQVKQEIQTRVAQGYEKALVDGKLVANYTHKTYSENAEEHYTYFHTLKQRKAHEFFQK